MKSVLIDVHEDNVRIVDTPEQLQGFYNLIKCDAIEIRHIMVGPKELLAVVDEEGLLKEDPRISMENSDGTHAELVGNILVCQEDGEDIIGLTNVEAEAVFHSLRYISYMWRGKPKQNVVLKGALL